MTETASEYSCSIPHLSEVASDESCRHKTEILQIRVSLKQKRKIENYAKNRECTVSEIMRDYINRLPNK